jgi:hypothetical protein
MIPPDLLADLYVCPVCSNVRRAWGGRPPLCDRAGTRHPDVGKVQPAPRSTNPGKIMGAQTPVVMVPLVEGSRRAVGE